MSDVRLGHLRAFVAVAECGSFTDAATHLGMTQPSVTRAVAALERSIGVTLVDRSTHHCTVTFAGDRLLPDVRTAIDALDRGIDSITVSRASQRSLRVALKPDSDAGLLSDTLRRYQADGTCRPIELVFRETHELGDVVRKAVADVALIVVPHTDVPDLPERTDAERVWREKRVAVLATGHPFAERDDLSVTDFADQPVITWPSVPAPYDRFYRGADGLRAGDPMPSGPSAHGLAEALRLVELSRGITFLPVSVADRFRRTGIALRTVEGLSDAAAYFVWRAGSRDRAIAALVQAALASAADGSQTG